MNSARLICEAALILSFSNLDSPAKGNAFGHPNFIVCGHVGVSFVRADNYIRFNLVWYPAGRSFLCDFGVEGNLADQIQIGHTDDGLFITGPADVSGCGSGGFDWGLFEGLHHVNPPPDWYRFHVISRWFGRGNSWIEGFGRLGAVGIVLFEWAYRDRIHEVTLRMILPGHATPPSLLPRQTMN